MDLVHGIINRFIHGFNPALHDYLTMELLCLVLARAFHQLLYKGIGFALGNKFRRLDGIHQDFKFRQFELFFNHMVPVTSAVLFALHGDSEMFQFI